MIDITCLNTAKLIACLMLLVVAYRLWLHKLSQFFTSRSSLAGGFGVAEFSENIWRSGKVLAKQFLRIMIIDDHRNNLFYSWLAILVLGSGIAAWAIIPVDEHANWADLDVGVCYIWLLQLFQTTLLIIAAWSNNNPLTRAETPACIARAVSGYIAMGLVLLGIVWYSHSVSLVEITKLQHGGVLYWLFIPLFPLVLVYWSAGNAIDYIFTTVSAGYSGITRFLFELSGALQQLLWHVMMVIMFFGGWLSPRQQGMLLPHYGWLLVKVLLLASGSLLINLIIPKRRVDHIIKLAWHIWLPAALLVISWGFYRQI